MPHLRGITIHITDPNGKDLREWGVQYLREARRVSAYIQSTPDVAFQVSLQPNVPFIEHVPPSDTSGGEIVSTRKKSRRPKAGSEDFSTKQNHEKKNNDTLSSPVRSFTTPQTHSAPEFAFLAILYLDGRRIPERKIIVYTDPTDEDFNYPDGKVAFKHRWVQSANGRMAEYAWLFRGKAIEPIFDNLMIAGPQSRLEDQDDDALIKAMDSSGFDAQENMEKESKVGQIVVELRRIVLGEKRTEMNYRPRHQEGQEEDIDMEGAPQDVTHATGFMHKNTVKSQPLRVVDYWPYQPNEGPYAIFQFFYRSREQLQKFCFPGFPSPPRTTAAKITRPLNTQMADLTPLSISHPQNKTKAMQGDQDSYGTRTKKGDFRPDDSRRYEFGSEYREVRATSPSTLDEAEGKKPPKYAASPLPFLANKSVENTNNDSLSLKTSRQTTAEVSLPAEISLSSHTKYQLLPQGPPPQTLRLNTPWSITAEASSSALLSVQSTKEQIAKVTDKDDYRPISRDFCPSDQEEDANDQPATESDLETHAGDDDFNYAIDPKEDEGYDSLQSQFRNVRIQKRQRDDVEDSEDDSEARQEAHTAHLDGGWKQKGPKSPLTQGEGAHQDKKSKIAKQASGVGSDQDIQVGGVAQKAVHCTQQKMKLGEIDKVRPSCRSGSQ